MENSSDSAQEGGLIDALKKIGISNRYGKELFLNCVVVPLFDSSGDVAGMYSRKLQPGGQVTHLYLPGKRQGIVNRPAAASNESVILTESIIDALSLYQNGYPNVIPLYGTNGLTDYHLELFHAYRPKKIYLCLNNDDPGKKATIQIGEVLTGLGFNTGIIQLPEHKDVNDFFQAGKTFDDFTKLLIESESQSLAPGCFVEETGIGLLITRETRRYRIRGINSHSLERLRVEHPGYLWRKVPYRYHRPYREPFPALPYQPTCQASVWKPLPLIATCSLSSTRSKRIRLKSKTEADTAKKPYQL